MSALYENIGMPEAWDDMSNVRLEPDRVAAARAKDMSFLKKLRVYRQLPRAMIKQDAGKLVSVLSRLGRSGFSELQSQARGYGVQRLEGRHSIYAFTPPLDTLRMVVSHASVIDPAKPQDKKYIMVNDVRRAHVYATQQCHVLINLPEDGEAKEGEVGQLLLCLYGSRDAAKEWQNMLSGHLQDVGIGPGRGHPVVLHRPERTCASSHTATTT